MTQWGLDNLFNPGKRHMDDEKRRLQSTREEVGDSSGGRRIDLESGLVSISLRRPAADATETTDGAEPVELDAVLEPQSEPELALSGENDLEPDVRAVGDLDADAPADQAALPEPAPAPAPPAGDAAARRRQSAAAWARRG